LGFAKSILANENYRSGKYTTAFIPTYYPTGYFGEPMERKDHDIISLAAFILKEQAAER